MSADDGTGSMVQVTAYHSPYDCLLSARQFPTNDEFYSVLVAHWDDFINVCGPKLVNVLKKNIQLLTYQHIAAENWLTHHATDEWLATVHSFINDHLPEHWKGLWKYLGKKALPPMERVWLEWGTHHTIHPRAILRRMAFRAGANSDRDIKILRTLNSASDNTERFRIFQANTTPTSVSCHVLDVKIVLQQVIERVEAQLRVYAFILCMKEIFDNPGDVLPRITATPERTTYRYLVEKKHARQETRFVVTPVVDKKLPAFHMSTPRSAGHDAGGRHGTIHHRSSHTGGGHAHPRGDAMVAQGVPDDVGSGAGIGAAVAAAGHPRPRAVARPGMSVTLAHGCGKALIRPGGGIPLFPLFRIHTQSGGEDQLLRNTMMVKLHMPSLAFDPESIELTLGRWSSENEFVPVDASRWRCLRRINISDGLMVMMMFSRGGVVAPISKPLHWCIRAHSTDHEHGNGTRVIMSPVFHLVVGCSCILILGHENLAAALKDLPKHIITPSSHRHRVEHQGTLLRYSSPEAAEAAYEFYTQRFTPKDVMMVPVSYWKQHKAPNDGTVSRPTKRPRH